MIENYSFGKITVNGQLFTKDLKIYPDHVIPDWWRKNGHLLALEDIEDIIRFRPNIFVIGTGCYGMMTVPTYLRKDLKNANIKVIDENTKKAYKLFNRLLSNEENVVGAFHLTC